MYSYSKNGCNEGTPCKKHAIEHSPCKPSPKLSDVIFPSATQKPKIEQQSQDPANVPTDDKPGDVANTVADLKTSVIKLKMDSKKRSDFFQRRLDSQNSFFKSEIDKKLDQDAAMTDKEHEELITDITEMATRAYLRKVLERQVKRIVKDVIEDVLEEVVDDVIEDLVYRKLKERDAAIKGMLEGMLETKADQDELDDELAATRRTLEEQRRQIVAILGWIQDRS